MKRNAAHLVELYSSSPTGIRDQTSVAVEETLRRQNTSLLLGLDGVSILDDAVISGTIVALRKLRDVGGTVRLLTGNPIHHERLSQLGLDRVFDILATPDEGPESVSR
jgi:anti-anti-sigma regulatory factor